MEKHILAWANVIVMVANIWLAIHNWGWWRATGRRQRRKLAFWNAATVFFVAVCASPLWVELWG